MTVATDLDITKQMIMEQMQENTGRALCDSGDYYGRNWQRNATKTWDEMTDDPVTLEASVYKHGDKPELELMGSIKLAAWLHATLEYDAEMQSRFVNWVKVNDPEGEEYDLTHMEQFAEHYNDEKSRWSHDQPKTTNSYNGECDLSQTIQFVEFSFEGDVYVALQVHGGCDVRGGYSSPRLYKSTVDYFGSWNIDGYACASHQWDEGMSDSNDHKALGLKDYPVHDLVWVPTLAHGLEALKQTDHDTECTRALMTATAATQERAYFEEFCDALDEHSVVVWQRKAYFVGDDGPEEIFAECYGMYE